MACSWGSTVLCLQLFFIASGHCAKLVNYEALDRVNPTNQDQSKGIEILHGKLIIGQTSLQAAKAPKSLLNAAGGFQADTGMWILAYVPLFGPFLTNVVWT